MNEIELKNLIKNLSYLSGNILGLIEATNRLTTETTILSNSLKHTNYLTKESVAKVLFPHLFPDESKKQ